MKKMAEFIKCEKVGNHSGKITLILFLLMFIGIYSLIQVDTYAVDLNSKSSSSNSNSNKLRKECIDYIFQFDATISEKTAENIKDYFYSQIENTKLLHMVNMKQRVYFSETESQLVIEEDTIYSPINILADDIIMAIKSLR